MKKWRLEDSTGRTIKIIEAEDHAAADVFGLKNLLALHILAPYLEREDDRLKVIEVNGRTLL